MSAKPFLAAAGERVVIRKALFALMIVAVLGVAAAVVAQEYADRNCGVRSPSEQRWVCLHFGRFVQ